MSTIKYVFMTIDRAVLTVNQDGSVDDRNAEKMKETKKGKKALSGTQV